MPSSQRAQRRQACRGGGGIAHHAENIRCAVSLRSGLEFHPGHFLYQLVSARVVLSRVGILSVILYSVPNFILAFIPAEINGNTLNTMTAFAVCQTVA